jgi:hypothetical protein
VGGRRRETVPCRRRRRLAFADQVAFSAKRMQTAAIEFYWAQRRYDGLPARVAELSQAKDTFMHHSRLCAVLIDCKTADVDEAAHFWATALGPSRGP